MEQLKSCSILRSGSFLPVAAGSFFIGTGQERPVPVAMPLPQ